MKSPLTLFELKPDQLHQWWPLLKRGLDEIKRKIGPDYIPEDIYAALRNGQTSCVIAQRSSRPLGFVVYYKQLRPFSARPELFIWAAWDLPYQLRQEGDDVDEMVARMWEYLTLVAKNAYGTDQIAWMTKPRRASAFARKFGWQPTFTLFQVTV